MLTIELTLRLLGWKKYYLYHNKQAPLYSASLLFFTFTFFPRESKSLYVHALRGLTNNDQWLVENAEIVRRARRLGFAKGRAQAKATSVDWKQEHSKEYERRVKTEIELNEARYAIRALSKMTSCD